jgi:hypothetical protein
MKKGSPSRVSRSMLFPLVALLGLTVAFGAGTAIASSSGDTVAVAAKKKCKKAKKGAVSAKKKKCKKHALPPPAPLTRATISWPAGQGDVDLHAFDASGNQSGFVGPPTNAIVQGIPNSTHSPDSTDGGSESFTDNIFVVGGPANREFSYVICFYDAASVTFTGVTRTGASSSLVINGTMNSAHTVTTSGGPPIPSAFACP